jgi:hypothetical protein
MFLNPLAAVKCLHILFGRPGYVRNNDLYFSVSPPPPRLYSPWRTLAASHIGGFLSYLDRREDSLDEWSARRKASTFTWQHHTERHGQTSMPWAGFDPTIPATNRPRPTPQTARPLWPATPVSASIYILTKASGFLHESSDVSVWLINIMVRLLVPFLAT